MYLDYVGVDQVFGRVGSISSYLSLTTTPVSILRKVESETLKFYLGDYGQTFYVYVGTALDRALNFLFKVEKPDKSEVNWRPIVSVNEGYLEHRVLMGNLDQVGIWHLQAYVDMDGWVGLGEPVVFEVFDLWM